MQFGCPKRQLLPNEGSRYTGQNRLIILFLRCVIDYTSPDGGNKSTSWHKSQRAHRPENDMYACNQGYHLPSRSVLPKTNVVFCQTKKIEQCEFKQYPILSMPLLRLSTLTLLYTSTLNKNIPSSQQYAVLYFTFFRTHITLYSHSISTTMFL